jgi:hypothetical protein
VHAINQIINVNSFYFTSGQNLKSFPRQIEFGNTRFTFTDGIQYLVKKGQHAVKLFDMTDGQTTYRLRLEDESWTLIGTK